MARTNVRIALCLNGGVSLAVWMSGVVHELDLVCRASRDRNIAGPADDPDSVEGAEHDHYRRWQQFCAERDVEVVVDIIAGTSAGGLNGAFLARALACGGGLPNLRTLWATKAALVPGKVLWDSGTERVPSVLNGDYFGQAIADTLRDIPDGVDESPVTLFLTATAIGSSSMRFADAAGGVFEVPDHRRMYRFRSGPQQEYDGGSFENHPINDFAADPDALALAARASAGFPVAFGPVAETPELAKHTYPSPPEEDNESGPTYLMDGGILDNAPLGPVLAEIATRRADARIDRKVVYLVPSNGVLSRAPVKPDQQGAPTWVQVAGSALGLPREADFRADIDQLQDILRSSRVRVTAATTMLSESLSSDEKICALLAGRDALQELYRQARITGTLLDIRTELAARKRTVPQLRSSGGGRGPAPGCDAGWAQAEPGGWPFGVSGALRTVRVLLSSARNDIEEVSADHDDEAAKRLVRLSGQFSDLSEKVSALDRAVAAVLYDPASAIMVGEPTDDQLFEAVNEQFDKLQINSQLDELINEAVALRIGMYGGEPGRLREILEAIEVVTGALAARSEDQAPPPFDFVRLGPDIQHPTFTTILPDDDNKLYGTRLQHFGAFGDENWRRWDWTWGRLDATAHIARLLNAPPQGADLRQVAELDPVIAELEREVIKAEDKTVKDMQDELHRIAGDLGRSAGETDQPLLDALRATKSGRDALSALAESVSRFLAQDDPRLPRTLTSVTSYARAAFDRRWRRMPFKQVLARLAFIRTRRTVWRWIEGKGPWLGRKGPKAT